MSDIHIMSDARIPQIIEKQIVQRKNKTEIARDLGVSTKTIQRDIHEPLYDTLIGEFFQLYKDAIKGFLSGEEKQNKLEALKELGRMYRAGMTKHTAHTEDLQATLNINVTENRKDKDELIKSLELTPDQWRKIEDSVTEEP